MSLLLKKALLPRGIFHDCCLPRTLDRFRSKQLTHVECVPQSMYLFRLRTDTTTTKHSLLLQLKNKYAWAQAVIVCVLEYSCFYYRARCHGLCGFYETFTGLKGHLNGCQQLYIIEDTCEHKSRRESSTIIITGFSVSVCVYIVFLRYVMIFTIFIYTWSSFASCVSWLWSFVFSYVTSI